MSSRDMDIATQRADHPSVEDLAAFLDRTLSDTERARIAEHLERCDVCRREISVAVDALRAHNRSHHPLKWAASIVAAAAIVILFVVPDTSVLTPPVTSPIERGVRSEGVARFSVVSPEESQSLREPLTFMWRSADERATYVLTLMNEVGDVVWSGRGSDTVLVAPTSLKLPNGTYFWLVDALLDRGREATTDVHSFRMTN